MKTIKLTQKQKEFIELMGIHFEQSGPLPAQSRIMALLLKAKMTEGVIVNYQGQAQLQKDSLGSLGLAKLITL